MQSTTLSLPGLTGQTSNPGAIDAVETVPHGEIVGRNRLIAPLSLP
jgi:hypothetical protein